MKRLRSWLAYWLACGHLNLGDEVINDFEAKVAALDVKSANRLAKSKFPESNLQFVFIGKADEIREKAKAYGEAN